jgi:hypothetical protein
MLGALTLGQYPVACTSHFCNSGKNWIFGVLYWVILGCNLSIIFLSQPTNIDYESPNVNQSAYEFTKSLRDEIFSRIINGSLFFSGKSYEIFRRFTMESVLN